MVKFCFLDWKEYILVRKQKKEKVHKADKFLNRILKKKLISNLENYGIYKKERKLGKMENEMKA